MLETEWEFYESNRDELVEKYCGKYIVISGNKVVSALVKIKSDTQAPAQNTTCRSIIRAQACSDTS